MIAQPPLTVTNALQAISAYEAPRAHNWRAQLPNRVSRTEVGFEISEWTTGDQRTKPVKVFYLYATRKNGRIVIARKP